MNAIDPKQATFFICVFIAVALLINNVSGIGFSASRSPAPTGITQDKPTEVPPRIRYLKADYTKVAGKQNVVIAASTEGQGNSSALASLLTRRFENPTAHISSSVFTEGFFTDGLFGEAWSNPAEIFHKLELAKSLDVLILAKQDTQYSQQPELQNIYTATITVTVQVIPISVPANARQWKFTANGPGFTKEVALKAAEERLQKQISTDDKMSLK